MITKETLQEMIIEQLNEMDFGLTSPLDAMTQAAKAEKINPLVAYLKKAGFAREVIAGMVKKFEALDGRTAAVALGAVADEDHQKLFSILTKRW